MSQSSRALLTSMRLLLAASIVVPILLFGFYAHQSYRATVHNAQDRVERLAAIVEEHGLKVFETINLVLDQVDLRLKNASWDEIRNSKQLWEELRTLEQRSEQVGAIFVVSADGQNLLTTRTFPAPAVNFSDRDYFRAHVQKGARYYVGHSYTGKISREPIFNFSVRKENPDGAFDGVIGISAYVSYFEKFYESLGNAADNFSIALMREDGHFMVRYPLVGNLVNLDTSSSIMQEVRKGTRGSFSATSPIDGAYRLVGHAKLRDFPVHALYSLDRRAIVAEWLAGLIPGAILTLAAGLSLFLACLFAFNRLKEEQQATAALAASNRQLTSESDRRERAEASLLQAQRLEAIGQLTSGIAHDFNNLLMVISGNLELAERRSDVDAMRRKFKSIRYATDRARALTQQLLAFARRHTPDAVTVDLNGVLERARSLIVYSLPQNVALTFDLADEPCPVKMNVSEFEAALLNIVGNARDAMPEGGTLTFATRRLDQDGKQSVELAVADTGMGMTPDVLARVYEPFFTTKPSGKGTGLGLSQVYGFVQQAAGTVEIASDIGRGTRVLLRFPRSDEPMTALSGPANLAKVASDDDVTVLIVEDHREVRQVTSAIVEELGHQVLVARNSAEALALLGAGQPVDILLTDVSLGSGLNGVDLGKQAVALLPSLKVLLITGFPGHASLLTQNEFAVLTKPFNRVDLNEALNALIGREGAVLREPAQGATQPQAAS